VGRSLSVTLVSGTTVLHTLSATVQANGTWSTSLPSNLVQALADASLTVRASYTSLYGASVNATSDLVVDTIAPSLGVTPPADTDLTLAQASAFELDYTVSDGVTSTPTRQVVVLDAAQQVQNISFTDSFTGPNGRLSADLSTLADGRYGVRVTSTDQAGNSSSQTVSVVIDNTAPTVSITRVGDSIVNLANPVASFEVRVSEAMLGLTATDLALTHASLVSFEPIAGSQGLRYLLQVQAATGISGTLGIDLAGGQFTDVAGNVNTAATPVTLAIDTLAPTLTITSNKDVVGAGQTATITFSFANDDPVGFEWANQQGDINLAQGTLSNLSGSGRTYTATFTPNAGVAGSLATVSVDAGSYTDAAGNPGVAAASPVLRVDTVAPTIASLERGTSVATGGLTNLDSVDFLVNFSEAMNADSLSASALVVQLNGTTLTQNITIGEPVLVSGNQYRISSFNNDQIVDT
jgi:hypothetical protein